MKFGTWARKAAGIVCLCLTAGAISFAVAKEGDIVYWRATVGHEGLLRLAAGGWDVGGYNPETGEVTIVVKKALLSDVRELAQVSDFQIEEISPVPDSSYKKPADVERILKELEAARPDLARVWDFGRTVEGKPIWAIRISAAMTDVPGGKKPAFLVDAMHHAREVMTPEVALDMAKQLIETYDTDEKVRGWVNNFEIVIVPMLNVDGNTKVWSGEPMWRKNARGGYGVDINRNYLKAWGTCNGSSGSRSSETFRGDSAGSEPETQALMRLAADLTPLFNISYHSFSEIVIHPYGCPGSPLDGPNAALVPEVARVLGDKHVPDSGSGRYQHGTSYDLLYPVDGGSLDWMYSAYGILSYVVELNGQAAGFQPSYARYRDRTVTMARAGWRYLLERMEGPRLDVHVPGEPDLMVTIRQVGVEGSISKKTDKNGWAQFIVPEGHFTVAVGGESPPLPELVTVQKGAVAKRVTIR